MASRKNKWRKIGDEIEVRRESKRYSDGSLWGVDVLYIRIKGRACAVVEPFEWGACAPGKTLSVLCGTYRSASPIEAAHMAARYLRA